MDGLLGWFDLSPVPSPVGPAAGAEVPLAQLLLLYAVVVLGVLFSEAVAMARAGGSVRVELSRSWLVVACVIALVVFPGVWRSIGTMPDTPLLVQLGFAAQGGVFWGVLLAGAEKGVAIRSAAAAPEAAIAAKTSGGDG
jgi:hypothetical protein